MGVVSVKIPGFGEVITPIQKGDSISDVVKKAIKKVNQNPNKPWRAIFNDNVLAPEESAIKVENETIYVTFVANVA
ncbi:MAG: hypothetical protein ACTSRA_22145 [Promethearchaeota archaeon]